MYLIAPDERDVEKDVESGTVCGGALLAVDDVLDGHARLVLVALESAVPLSLAVLLVVHLSQLRNGTKQAVERGGIHYARVL